MFRGTNEVISGKKLLEALIDESHYTAYKSKK